MDSFLDEETDTILIEKIHLTMREASGRGIDVFKMSFSFQ